MKALRVIPLLFVMLDGCIEPFPVDRDSDLPALVVDGMITNQPGPYTVKLFMSTAPSEDQLVPEMVRGATVWITDDIESAFPLTETQPGVYTTKPEQIQGETGHSYSLHVVTRDGNEFESKQETLIPAGTIDSLYGVYESNVINQTDLTKPQDAITFFVNGRSDESNTNGFQRWRSTAIYEILTFPEKRVIRANGEVIPDPLPCSGYINSNGVLQSIDTCSCCSCWVYEYPRNAVVSPPHFAEDNEYRSVAVARIPVEKWRFFRKYYLEVEQLSVSEGVYEFWKRVSAQQQGTGSLFQPNAIKVKGNMQCVSDPRKEVFGIFSAYSIINQSIFIKRADLPVQIPTPDEVTFDCRYVFDNADNIKPPFW